MENMPSCIEVINETSKIILGDIKGNICIIDGN